MTRLACRVATLAVLLVSVPTVVLANPEPTANDARVVGIGGASSAYLTNPSVIPINPANLASMEGSFQLTLSSTALVVDASAPIESPDEVNHTGWRVAPLPFFGLAARLHERFVLGFGAYIATGYGSSYDDITQIAYLDAAGNAQTRTLPMPMDQTVTFFEGEVAVTGSVRVHEMFDVGLALRLPFAKQTATLYEELLPPGTIGPTSPAIWGSVRQDVGGVGIPGILLGFTLHPTDNLDLAISYRSKVRIDMDGTIDIEADPPFNTVLPMLGVDRLRTQTAWYLPHKLRGGFALHLLDDRFMIAGDFYFQFHKEANRAQVFENTLENGNPLPFPDFATLSAPFLWHNVYGGALGVEIMATEHFPIRFGGSMSNSATSRRGAQYFTPPANTILGSASVGVGVHYPIWDVDFGTQLSWGRGSIPVIAGLCQGGEQVKVGCPGRYGVTSIFLTLSLTVRLGMDSAAAADQPEGVIDENDADVESLFESQPAPVEESPAPAEESAPVEEAPVTDDVEP